MTISDRGTLASIVRDGDYISFTADKGGVSVQYSPTAAAFAPIIGAFAAKHGRVKYLGATEAADLLKNRSTGAEEALIRAIEGCPDTKKATEATKILNALVSYASSGYEIPPIWDGRLTDFHKEVLYPAAGLRNDGHLVRNMNKVAAMTPAVEVTKLEREYYVRVDWAMLAAEDPEETGRLLG